MPDRVKHPVAVLAAVTALGAGAFVGAGASGEEGVSSAASDSGAAVEEVAYRAVASSTSEEVLDLGGLILRARCAEIGQGRSYLLLTAATVLERADARVWFVNQVAGEPAAYRFHNASFGSAYGEWDLLGTTVGESAGVLAFTRADGGRVAVSFAAGEGTPEAECSLSGTATYAPSPGLVADAYIGISCPGEPNSIACDRIALFVATEDRPQYVTATVAGHRFRLGDAGWRSGGNGASFEGALSLPGLLHDGPLAVPAGADERWIGTPPVEVAVRLQAVYDDGTVREWLDEVPLAAGYG